MSVTQINGSVIITSYNYGRFLRAAIDSALKQTAEGVEVIVVDDGSKDDSRSVMADYGTSIVALLRENGGQAAAMNTGFSASRGKVVCFVDSDDMLAPDAMSIAIDALADGRSSKAHWPLQVVDRLGRARDRVVPGKTVSGGDLLADVLERGPAEYSWPPTSGNVWSRCFLERVLPIPEADYRTCPDLYLSALAPLYGEVHAIQGVHGMHRQHGDNHGGVRDLDAWIATEVHRWEQCKRVFTEHCRRLGYSTDAASAWDDRCWVPQIHQAVEQICEVVPSGESVVLLDEGMLPVIGPFRGRRALPFPDVDGQFGGFPASGPDASAALQNVLARGVHYVAVAWPAYWWLDYYTELGHLLDQGVRRVEAPAVVVYDMA